MTSPPAATTTYYGVPMLKESVWTADIPLYYFCGGAAGAAMTLGSGIQLVTRGWHPDCEMRRLSAKCHWIGIAGSTIGAAFLIHDLGRPSRFLFMLRVFRPTSPMSVGAWILAVAAPSAIATGLFINRPGLLGLLGEAAGYVSGLFGAALAGYTGVLVSNTVVPIWQESRRWMPILFISSAAATAASLLDLLDSTRTGSRLALAYGTAGRVMELAAAKRIEHLCSRIPQVGEPFQQGAPGLLWKAAGILTGASLAVSFFPGQSKNQRRVAGVLAAAGSLCLRFAVHALGDASARDPRATVQQQRLSTERARART